MGMFDRVWVPCPRCGRKLEFQSKAGPCILKVYHLDNAPNVVLADIIGDSEWCKSCDLEIEILGSVNAYPGVLYTSSAE